MEKFVQFIKQPKNYFLVLLAITTLIISIVVTIKYYPQKSSSIDLENDTFNPEVLAAQSQLDLSQAPEDLHSLGILLLGYGGAGHQGGYLTDVIQLIYIDFDKSQVNLISVPRDLWVTLPNGKQSKINAAFTLGDDPNQKIESGGQVAKQMMSLVTGLDINYFIAVDFVGFQRLIGETLDGITVDVPETLDDPWYPIKGEEQNPCGHSDQEIADLTANYSGFELEKQFECRYKHLHFQQGSVVMEGGDALEYVRSRHGSTAGDFSRSQRQHALLKAIRDKIFTLDYLSNAPDFFQLANHHVTTDIDLEIVKYLVPAVKGANNFQTKSIVLSTENVFQNGRSSSGQFILLPNEGMNNWNQVHSYLQSQID